MYVIELIYEKILFTNIIKHEKNVLYSLSLPPSVRERCHCNFHVCKNITNCNLYQFIHLGNINKKSYILFGFMPVSHYTLKIEDYELKIRI